MGCRTLIVEDDPHIMDVVEFLLREQDHRVDRATDGTGGWNLVQKNTYGLIILDLGLPGIPGLDLFKRIRHRSPDQAVIMLTAMGEEEHRVKGLQLGADDYIVKPFSNDELIMRVRNLLRRCPPPPDTLQFGRLTLCPHSAKTCVGSREVELPPHEYRLLEALVRSPEQTFTRDQLLDIMYGPETACNDRTVDQAVTRLRRKLRDAVPDGNLIRTVYGWGYRLAAPRECL